MNEYDQLQYDIRSLIMTAYRKGKHDQRKRVTKKQATSTLTPELILANAMIAFFVEKSQERKEQLIRVLQSRL